jgi:hypothetical protein
MPIDLLKDFQDRVDEVDLYFNFIWMLENTQKLSPNKAGIEKIKVYNKAKTATLYKLSSLLDNNSEFIIHNDINKILKGSCYLILYNLIEGTFTNALKTLMSSINSKNYPLKHFQKEIFKIWIKYKYKSFSNIHTLSSNEQTDMLSYLSMKFETIFDDIFQIEEKIIKKGIKLTDYDAYVSEVGSDFSGNLDARKIKEVIFGYGLKLPKKLTCDDMFTIKIKRNSLGHGNETFSDVGKTNTIEDLILIKRETVNFLRQMLKFLEAYIDKEGFLKKK